MLGAHLKIRASRGDKTEQGTASATGDFTSGISGLSHNTLYYVRAYATNTGGTVYGDNQTFTTLKLNQTITFEALSPKTFGGCPVRSVRDGVFGSDGELRQFG